ncbi:hypothetical protein ACO22_07273 [Paracoccidioides brasiliensis]|uniref:Uncharacterized protein n=1 Tax=Paracoccidioides brasiliensis TaxID=121759 RepID=A0A1D2J534_PARBR|nr:hypothetical protein ACO22_07273 [Paracoccidioides brasiliensis]
MPHVWEGRAMHMDHQEKEIQTTLQRWRYRESLLFMSEPDKPAKGAKQSTHKTGYQVGPELINQEKRWTIELKSEVGPDLTMFKILDATSSHRSS